MGPILHTHILILTAFLWLLPSSSGHSAPGDSICMYRRRGCVDAVDPAPAEHCKDRSYLASNRRQHQLPQVALRVGTDHVTPTTSVRDLGIYVDCGVSMRTHVSKTVSSCFAVLRQLRSIRRSVSPTVLQSLVVSLVLSLLGYGNATLAGLPGNQLDRLQSPSR